MGQVTVAPRQVQIAGPTADAGINRPESSRNRNCRREVFESSNALEGHSEACQGGRGGGVGVRFRSRSLADGAIFCITSDVPVWIALTKVT